MRGIVPKTEANLLMHSDLWAGPGEAESERLRGDSKMHGVPVNKRVSACCQAGEGGDQEATWGSRFS